MNPNRDNNDYDEEVWKLLPTGRIGQIEEIANLATFVSSDYASWLSGETFHKSEIICGNVLHNENNKINNPKLFAVLKFIPGK